jgi:hypothetical protein
VGAEHAQASQALLGELGVRVPASPVPTGDDRAEPEPMGRIRSMYLEVSRPANGPMAGQAPAYQVGVVFQEAWPVELLADDGSVLALGTKNRPVAVQRSAGRGSVIVIADTDFALNKNLEYFGGEPFDGG